MRNCLLLPKQNTHPRQPDKFLQDVQEHDGITSPILHLKQEVRALEVGMLHDSIPTRASYPCLALRKESSRTKVIRSGPKWKLQDKMDKDGIMIHLHNHPRQVLTPTIPTTRRRDVWENQVKVWALSISPGSKTSSREPIRHSKVITRTDTPWMKKPKLLLFKIPTAS